MSSFRILFLWAVFAQFLLSNQLGFIETSRQKAGDFLSYDLYKKSGNSHTNTLLVIGGIHGDEPGGYFAASLLATNYTILKGSLWIVPNMNFESLILDRRGIYGDMNRKFAKVATNDPDYNSVLGIKKIILEPAVDLVINLHDGHGFYRDRWKNYIFNPRAWGQTIVIDQKSLEDVKFGNLDELSKDVTTTLNRHLNSDHHFFSIKNTETRYKDEEMQQSLTYFAITNLKPAFAQETSKNIDALALKVEYHLRAIEEFMKKMDIEYSRDFELTFEDIQRVISQFGKLTINDNISLDLVDLRSVIRFVPMSEDENFFKFDHPLGAVRKIANRYDLYVGNKHISSLYPQHFDLNCSSKSADFLLDGKLESVAMGSSVSVKDSFEVAKSDMRVNVIGFSKQGVISEDGIKLTYKDMVKNFSLDVKQRAYRVEFYEDDSFCGMISVRFE